MIATPNAKVDGSIENKQNDPPRESKEKQIHLQCDRRLRMMVCNCIKIILDEKVLRTPQINPTNLITIEDAVSDSKNRLER